MKSRLILNLVLFLALVGLGLYAYLAPDKKSAEPTFRISTLARDEISSISIEPRGKAAIALKKHEGAWQMLAPFTTRADPFQIDRLLDIAQATSTQQFAREQLERFNLDSASLVVTINGKTFSFGSINSVTNEQYLATDEAVYLVPPYLGYSVPADPSKLFSHKLLGPNESPVAFDFGAWKLVKDERGSWKPEGNLPKKEMDLSADDINQWAAEWQLASSLETRPHDRSRGRERIKLKLQDGREVVVEIITRKPVVVLARIDENMRYQFGADAGSRLLDPGMVAASH